MIIPHRQPPGKYRLSVDDFRRLDETGVFGIDRTELLNGDIIVMNAEYRSHAWVAGELGYRLRRVLEDIGSDLTAMTASVTLSDHDMPLPDIVLTCEPLGPGPIPLTSIALVVEVSSSTVQRDMGVKQAIYARVGVPEYWVADVNTRIVRQMWMPADEAYSEQLETPFGGAVTAVTLEGVIIETARL